MSMAVPPPALYTLPISGLFQLLSPNLGLYKEQEVILYSDLAVSALAGGLKVLTLCQEWLLGNTAVTALSTDRKCHFKSAGKC